MAFFVTVVVFDSKQLSHSYSWCGTYVTEGSCEYLPYFGMVIVEAIAIIIWVC